LPLNVRKANRCDVHLLWQQALCCSRLTHPELQTQLKRTASHVTHMTPLYLPLRARVVSSRLSLELKVKS